MEYIYLNEIDHILQRPDITVGSKNVLKSKHYIYCNNSIKEEEIRSCSAIERIFIECVANCLDNIEKSKIENIKYKEIRINLNTENSEISLYNDGKFIKINKTDNNLNLYNHEMVFGILRTSSNYNDDISREICGKNGIGVKCANIFSEYFIVEGYDPDNNLYYKQKWENNMKKKNNPIIYEAEADSSLKKNKTGFTKITYKTDFSQFKGLSSYKDIEKIFHKIIIDASLICCINNINLIYNDERIQIKSLLEYAKLFQDTNDDMKYIELYFEKDVCILSYGSFINNNPVSFVNNLLTPDNGKHVDAWKSKIIEVINSKFNVNFSKYFQQYFKIFLLSTVDKPEYDSQNKNKLVFPNIKISLENKYINKIQKFVNSLSIIQNIERDIEIKNIKKMCKSNNKVDNKDYDAPNKNNPKKNILIICEGLSAKTYAVAGLKVGLTIRTNSGEYETYKGRDNIGIYPLRGKLLNVRNSTTEKIYKNKVIFDLLKILNITDKKIDKIAYSKILIIPDPDTDGIHIEGLIINFLHYFCPEIIQNFIYSMKIPIIKVKKHLFFSLEEFKKAEEINNFNNHNIKYYKGLGTSTVEDVENTFGKKIIKYVYDEETDEKINLAFLKTNVEERKKWVKSFTKERNLISNNYNDATQQDENISFFIDNKLILYSLYDCKRSIPNLIDGLKDSQRKVVYGILKYNKPKSIKVAQLGAFIAQVTDYKHGEQNLFETIIKMAQDFCGSNNIPLLKNEGMFGTRLEGGCDYANARYIFTNTTRFLDKVIRKEDSIILEYEEKDESEPKIYYPIIPILFLNGSIGIGTGFSCNIPMYNLTDLINIIKKWLEDLHDIDDMEEPTPYYNKFKGNIMKIDNNRFETVGIFKRITEHKIIIEELPVNSYPSKFKELLTELKEKNIIISWENNCEIEKINFTINLNSDAGILTDCEIIKMFKLKTFLNTNNIVVFDHNHTIKELSFKNCMMLYMKNRYNAYAFRKYKLVEKMKSELNIAQKKLNFLIDVENSNIIVFKKDESSIKQQYFELNKCEIEPSFLNIPLINFTKKYIEKMQNNVSIMKKELVEYSKKTVKDLWLEELEELKEFY